MYERVPTTNETMQAMLPFLRAVNSSLDATSEVFGIDISEDYAVRLSEAEEDVCFPANIDFSARVVKIHKASFDAFVEETCELYPNVTYEDLAKIHIAATLIPGVIAQRISPRNGGAVNRLYDHIANTDALEVALEDPLLAIDPETKNALKLATLLKDEESAINLNRNRLAIGVVAYYESRAIFGEDLFRCNRKDFGNRVISTFRNGLGSVPTDLERYLVLARAMGVDELNIETLYHREISPFELAAAFPMDISEIMVIAKDIGANI